MILEIKDLSVNYGKANAVSDVSLNIEEGSVVTIIGANGAGKSTILKTVSGLLKAASGEIWFMGSRIDKLSCPDIVKQGIALVPEGKMLFSPLTVLDNLKMGSYLRKDKKNFNGDIEAIYAHFPVLKEKRSQPAGSLSGGQQQMLAVARALMAKPKLLLMDEPSVGLSPILVNEVSNIIREINKDGISILLVEQNANMALKLAKKAYVLEIGKILLEGNSDEIAGNELVKKAYLGGQC